MVQSCVPISLWVFATHRRAVMKVQCIPQSVAESSAFY